MATWMMTWLRFHKPPTPEQLECIKVALKGLDHDAPVSKLTPSGLDGVSWRSPIRDLESVMSLLHIAGHPCEGCQSYDHGWDTQEPTPDQFVQSNSDLFIETPSRGFGLSLVDAAEFLSAFPARWRISKGDVTSTQPRESETMRLASTDIGQQIERGVESGNHHR